TPKRLGLRLLGKEAPSAIFAATPEEVFWVYQDAESDQNHFKPSGYMGDIGDVKVKEAWEVNPHSGNTCIRVIYEAKGEPPHNCAYNPPCKYAGVYWLEPANNWGREDRWKNRGFNLSAYKRLTFWARADSDCKIEFKVGGVSGKYGDSLNFSRSK